MRLDRATSPPDDFAHDPQLLTHDDRIAERDGHPGGHAPDALMKDRPAHRLVQERALNASVHRAVVALVTAIGNETRLGAVLRDFDVQVEAGVIEAPAREAPVLEIDSEVTQPRH